VVQVLDPSYQLEYPYVIAVHYSDGKIRMSSPSKTRDEAVRITAETQGRALVFNHSVTRVSVVRLVVEEIVSIVELLEPAEKEVPPKKEPRKRTHKPK